MEQSPRENRKYYAFLLFALMIVTFFTTKFYLSQKKDNQALKLKIIMLNKERKKPKAWAKLLQPTYDSLKLSDPIQDKISNVQAATLKNEKEKNDIILADLTTGELAQLLNQKMQTWKTLNIKDLQYIQEIADEILSREPETYSAYKAKLISLLTLEGKYLRPINDSDINQLLELMASYDLSSESILQKESSLIASANQELTNIAQELDQVINAKEDIDLDLDTMEMSDPAFRILQSRSYELSLEESNLDHKMSELQSAISNDLFPKVDFLNEDIIEIPFMRSMAKNDFTTTLENAEVFITQFPTSQIGYYYAIKSLTKLGREDEIPPLLSNSKLSHDEQRNLLLRLNLTKNDDPKKYWDKLNF